VKIALRRYRTLLHLFWAVWLAGVVCGSLISGNEMSSLEKVVPFLHYDKLMHYGAYTGLAFLSVLAFERRRGIAVALSMILLGAAIELGQHYSPGRTPDLDDAIANSIGVCSGIVLARLSEYISHRFNDIRCERGFVGIPQCYPEGGGSRLPPAPTVAETGGVATVRNEPSPKTGQYRIPDN
jgi:VanZ like family